MSDERISGYCLHNWLDITVPCPNCEEETNTKNRTIEKIKSFLTLSYGDGSRNQGVEFSQERIDEAIKRLRVLDSLFNVKSTAFPRHDGEIVLTFYFPNYTLDFTLETDGTWDFDIDPDLK